MRLQGRGAGLEPRIELINKRDFVDHIDAGIATVNVIANALNKIEFGIVIRRVTSAENHHAGFSNTGNGLVVGHLIDGRIHTSFEQQRGQDDPDRPEYFQPHSSAHHDTLVRLSGCWRSEFSLTSGASASFGGTGTGYIATFGRGYRVVLRDAVSDIV